MLGQPMYDEDMQDTIMSVEHCFTMSEQSHKLWKDGWMKVCPEDPGKSVCEGPEDGQQCMVPDGAFKDSNLIDNDFFVANCGVGQHDSQLLSASAVFPAMNRFPEEGRPAMEDLKKHLVKYASQPYVRRLAEFNVILFLSNILDANQDIPNICGAIVSNGAISSGYTELIDMYAGIG